MHILLLSGSFRAGSYNTLLLNEAKAHFGSHSSATFPIEQLPFYADTLDGDNRPPMMRDFLEAVTAADAIIFATPEFNHSLPAVLKNAIDWASRPAFQSPLRGKPYTVLSATPSPAGGVHAQAHLKHVMDSTLAVVYPAVAYTLPGAPGKVTDGRLTDEKSLQRLERHILGFLEWLDKSGDK